MRRSGVASLRQWLVLGDGRRGGATGGAARVAQRLVEALGRVRPGGHFTLQRYKTNSLSFSTFLIFVGPGLFQESFGALLDPQRVVA